ncbi:MAG: hypothetical protein IPJ65_40145 [Archangiaceae bacterium]|nr:hypothetical protein [Archangiaceae bacterium]
MRATLAALCFTVFAAACASSAQEQRRAEQHQFNSDEAANQGRYQVAGEEQRNAADSHHKAVTKAIDEGVAIPPQTEKGGPNPDGGR